MTSTAPAGDAQTDGRVATMEPVESGRARALIARLERRPIATIGGAGLLAALAQVWWVSTHRHVGGFGIDETGYLTSAFRMHRAWEGGSPVEVVREFMGTPRSAPLVMFLSVPFMAVFGRTTTAALMAQASLYVVTAVAVSAIVARLATRRAALVAGVVCLGLPTATVTARNYQLASGATAFLCLAMLALVSSDRGERRGAMIGFGAAIGAMLLSRTMPISFLPGIVVAAAWYVHPTRRARLHLAGAAVVAVVVAGPWWIGQWSGVFGYLFSFGYGNGTAEIEYVPLALRPLVRLGILMIDVRPMLLVPAAIVTVMAVVGAARWRRSGAVLRAWPVADRELGAIVVVVVVGWIALLSSSNNGTWFQSPLETLGVAAVCVVGARLGGRAVARLAVIASIAAVANLVLMTTDWRPGSASPVGGATWSIVVFGGTEDQQAQDFGVVDPRFDASASWEVRGEAERDWAAAAATVVDRIRATADEDAIVTVVGELGLLNANTLAFASELQREPLVIESTAAPEAMLDGRVRLEPTSQGRERLLVSVQPRSRDGVEGFDPTATLAEAARRGWIERERIEVPYGAVVILFVHPEHRE